MTSQDVGYIYRVNDARRPTTHQKARKVYAYADDQILLDGYRLISDGTNCVEIFSVRIVPAGRSSLENILRGYFLLRYTVITGSLFSGNVSGRMKM